MPITFLESVSTYKQEIMSSKKKIAALYSQETDAEPVFAAENLLWRFRF
jgi:hypothetical protein